MLRLIMVVLMGWGAAGCSFVFGRAPSTEAWESIEKRQTPPPKACSQTRIPAYVDTFVAGISLGFGAYALEGAVNSTCADGDDCWDGVGYLIAAPLLLTAVITGISAGYGFSSAADCNRYQATWDAKWGGMPAR